MKRETIAKMRERVYSGFADKPTPYERRQRNYAREHGRAAIIAIHHAIRPPQSAQWEEWNPDVWEDLAVHYARAAFRYWRQFRRYTEP